VAGDYALATQIARDAANAVIALATGPQGQEHLVVNGDCKTCDAGSHPGWKES
jgi:hypothetical protein